VLYGLQTPSEPCAVLQGKQSGCQCAACQETNHSHAHIKQLFNSVTPLFLTTLLLFLAKMSKKHVQFVLTLSKGRNFAKKARSTLMPETKMATLSKDDIS